MEFERWDFFIDSYEKLSMQETKQKRKKTSIYHLYMPFHSDTWGKKPDFLSIFASSAWINLF